ncbi:ABC transporter ATP-binding protein [Branchiibius cervicis]|uniref:ABC transporter ATP-binding protein n=1 Tax=Branchiibius cervicis TaxID=908252 RepID=A0ABW2ASZ6_9MICO
MAEVTNMLPILSVAGLVKDYRVRRQQGWRHETFRAVDDVSFELPTGGSLAIVGESGSGKTTSARIIVGLERATQGSIRVDGQEWRPTEKVSGRDRRERGGRIQMVFQDPYLSLDRRQTIGSCLDEALRIHTDLERSARAKRVADLLSQVRLDQQIASAHPRQLSGGQRQRVAIARSLAAEPDILVLDEALASLDVSTQAQVLKLLADVRRTTGVAFLFISHDLPIVGQICDSVIVMKDGKVVERGLSVRY